MLVIDQSLITELLRRTAPWTVGGWVIRTWPQKRGKLPTGGFHLRRQNNLEGGGGGQRLSQSLVLLSFLPLLGVDQPEHKTRRWGNERADRGPGAPDDFPVLAGAAQQLSVRARAPHIKHCSCMMRLPSHLDEMSPGVRLEGGNTDQGVMPRRKKSGPLRPH